MGVGTRSVIVVGYTYDEIYEIYQAYEDVIDFNEWYEDNGLESFSPYYDANREDCLFGTIIHDTKYYSYSLFSLDSTKLQEVTKDLTDKFGVAPAVYLSPDVD